MKMGIGMRIVQAYSLGSGLTVALAGTLMGLVGILQLLEGVAQSSGGVTGAP